MFGALFQSETQSLLYDLRCTLRGWQIRKPAARFSYSVRPQNLAQAQPTLGTVYASSIGAAYDTGIQTLAIRVGLEARSSATTAVGVVRPARFVGLLRVAASPAVCTHRV